MRPGPGATNTSSRSSLRPSVGLRRSWWGRVGPLLRPVFFLCLPDNSSELLSLRTTSLPKVPFPDQPTFNSGGPGGSRKQETSDPRPLGRGEMKVTDSTRYGVSGHSIRVSPRGGTICGQFPSGSRRLRVRPTPSGPRGYGTTDDIRLTLFTGDGV